MGRIDRTERMDKFTYQQYCITACAIVLLLINYSIYQREQHIAHGQTVYVQLAPVDPRSLMQGDYMALDFELDKIQTRSKFLKSTFFFLNLIKFPLPTVEFNTLGQTKF